MTGKTEELRKRQAGLQREQGTGPRPTLQPGGLAYQHTFQGEATQNVNGRKLPVQDLCKGPFFKGNSGWPCLQWTAISRMFCQCWEIIVLHQFKGQDVKKNS